MLDVAARIASADFRLDSEFDDELVVTSDTFERLNDPSDVYRAGKAIAQILSEISSLCHSGEPVSAGSVLHRRGSGVVDAFHFMTEDRYLTFPGKDLVRLPEEDANLEPIERVAYRVGKTRDDARDVLRYLQVATWGSLYKALEVIEAACGGERGLIAQEWAPAGAIKRVKATANRDVSIGEAARHAPVAAQQPTNVVPLADAILTVRTVAYAWLREMEQGR